MTDTVDVKYLFKGTRRITVKMTGISDGTGESTVGKIDISSLVSSGGSAPSKTVAEKVEGMVQGFTSVRLLWAHDTDDELALLGTGYTYFDWADAGGNVDPASTGGTGDIILTSVGAASGATYDITITLRLKD